MRAWPDLLQLCCVLALSACGDSSSESADAAHGPVTFFVTSDKSMTGDLGGLEGADARCQALADAAGFPGTFHAYLSAESDDGEPIHARDRIGRGPWHNARGALLARDLEALHARTGDVELFLDDHGAKVPGQWPGSPEPNEHDILTGSDEDGRLLPGFTCESWTSSSADAIAQVGHSDGLGPRANPNPPYASWSSSHANTGCNDTGPGGGAGRLYCFATE